MSILKETRKKITKAFNSFFKTDKEEFTENLERFDAVWRTIKGRTDIKSKLMLLLDPEKPQTTTFLNKSQAHFQSIAYFMAESWSEFEPMRTYARQQALSALGVEGKGIDASVRLTGALAESKILQRLGITTSKGEEKSA